MQSSRPKRRQRSGRRRSSGRRDLSGTAAEEQAADAEPIPSVPWDLAQFEVPPAEGKVRFHDFDLPVEVMHAIADLGFEYCTPIQGQVLGHTLSGVDVSGRAQTGTGKSAVFLITIINHMLRSSATERRRKGTPRALILAPTRELALQIERDGKALSKYTPVRIVSVFGGMDYEKQRRMLTEQTVDILVATPGRLLDFKRQGDVHLSRVEILIIDEADRMLDMGFIPDVQQIIQSTPPKSKRQTMLFSATLTPEVTRIASRWTKDPVVIEVEPEQVAVDTVEQIVYIVTVEEKFPLLYNLITLNHLERVIVFGNRRDETRRLCDRFERYGINSALLSGEVDQKKRIKTLEDFRSGKIRVLVATDVAARGLHVDGVSHVVNYNLPLDPEDYVHRIGRTGRAGASGISVSFAAEDDAFQLPVIEKYIGRELQCVHPEEEWLVPPKRPEGAPSTPSRRSAPSRSSSRSSSGRSSQKRPRSGKGRTGGRSRPGGETAAKEQPE